MVKIRVMLSKLAGISEDEILFDESGKYADLAWRVPILTPKKKDDMYTNINKFVKDRVPQGEICST